MQLGKTLTAAGASMALWFSAGCVRNGANPLTPTSPPAATKPAAVEQDDNARLLEVGKKLFVAKCGSCHDEDGSKALASGPPLSRRALTDEVIAENVAPRLRSASDAEKRAVAAYIRSFLQTSVN